MFGSEILDVVIGLIFVYVLFSLLCSTMTEGIARMFAMRSGTLESAIRNMIEGSRVLNQQSDQTQNVDPKAPAEVNSVTLDVKALYTSARLRTLARAGWFDRLRVFFAADDKKWRAARPSYIPARSFALALFDTLLEAKGEQKTDTQLSDDELQAQIDEVKSAVEMVMPEGMQLRDQVIALLNREDNASLALQVSAQSTFTTLRESVKAIEPDESYLKKTLLSILDRAEEEAKDFDEALAKARIGVEEWFDDSMDRVSGWYARNTRSIVIGFAVVVTLIFNIDTLAIATALQTEPLLREAIVARAEAFIDTQASDAKAPAEATITELQDEIEKLGVPIGWVVIINENLAQNEKPDAPVSSDPARQAASLPGSLIAVVTSPAVAEWNLQNPAHVEEIEKATRYRQEWPSSPTDWGKKIAGLFVTIVALSLGAPFWFDALNKLVNLRAAGRAPDRADAVDASIAVNAPGR